MALPASTATERTLTNRSAVAWYTVLARDRLKHNIVVGKLEDAVQLVLGNGLAHVR